jgi:hypothetical protein
VVAPDVTVFAYNVPQTGPGGIVCELLDTNSRLSGAEAPRVTPTESTVKMFQVPFIQLGKSLLGLLQVMIMVFMVDPFQSGLFPEPV